jgi:hypothetical protein
LDVILGHVVFAGAGGFGALLVALEFVGVLFVDLFEGRGGVVGNFCDHFGRVNAELDAADVADGGVEGAEDEFGAFDFDSSEQQGIDGFHEGDLDRLFVLEEGGEADARGGIADGAKHALVEVAELLSAKRGRAATDAGDFDMSAGFGCHKLFGPLGVGNNFFCSVGLRSWLHGS